jgi:hypothetical protein
VCGCQLSPSAIHTLNGALAALHRHPRRPSTAWHAAIHSRADRGDHGVYRWGGTTAVNHSSGPRTPTRSSPMPTVNPLPARDTSGSQPAVVNRLDVVCPGQGSRVYNLLVERPELVRTRWPKIHIVIEDVHEVIAQERREHAARAAPPPATRVGGAATSWVVTVRLLVGVCSEPRDPALVTPSRV